MGFETVFQAHLELFSSIPTEEVDYHEEPIETDAFSEEEEPDPSPPTGSVAICTSLDEIVELVDR